MLEGGDYVQTLGIITALLISELRNENAFYESTDPPLLGIVAVFISETTWYLFILSLLGSVATGYGSLRWKVPIDASSPTIFALAGLIAYCFDRGLNQYIRYLGQYSDTIPPDQTTALFMASSIPLFIFIVSAPVYTRVVMASTTSERLEDLKEDDNSGGNTDAKLGSNTPLLKLRVR
jgi:hypothetical protein